jgi:succinate dehydrogenase/fumarate reductase flavoprotein subunit
VIYEIQQGEEIINVTAYCKSLILSSGGYGSDFYDTKESILKEFLIQFYNLPTFSNFYTQGNGIKIARNKGAVLIDQRQAEIYPTCFVDLLDRFNRHKILAPDLFRKLGGILMNKRGKRFCNEIGNRRYVSQNILKNCDIVTDPNIIKQYEGFLIINEEIRVQYGEEIEDYIAKGYLKKYKSFDDFSKQMNISEYYTNIRKSIINYNQGYDKKRDKFGKTIFPCKFTMGETIYVGIVTPCIYHTLGGVRINENSQVLNEEKRPIKGFFASGEVVGGVHGAMAMQGNILTEAAVFGRVAAKSAVDFIMK